MLLSITGSIEGHVTDLDGLPIAGVALYIEPEDESYGLDWPGIPAITNGLGEYSFSDLPPGEYEVGLWSTIAVEEHPYTAPSSPTPVLGDLLVGAGETLYDVDFECWLPKQTIEVFFLGDDTGSHANVNKGYFAAILQIIGTLQSDERFDWEFGIGRFEDFPSFTDPFDQPFILTQPIIPDDDPNFESLITYAISEEASAPGTGGDRPETLNEGLYQSALQAGFSSTSLDSDYSMSIILAGTDAGTVYQEADPIVDTIHGVDDVALTGFTAWSTNEDNVLRNQTPNGEGATIQDAVDALNYVGARVIGLKSDPEYGIGIADDGGPLPAYSLATGAVNYSEETLSYVFEGETYDIPPGEPLVIHTLADDLDDVLAEAIVNQVEYRPPLASIGVHVLPDGEGWFVM
ncbi:MAG: carboxypeptidase-like regulatory domain-containing protein, partial [Planctomycetia bacterium]|nr:carboxypeptidase-like regulatory domain-containing protein [Planctomycetia bacterium]